MPVDVESPLGYRRSEERHGSQIEIQRWWTEQLRHRLLRWHRINWTSGIQRSIPRVRPHIFAECFYDSIPTKPASSYRVFRG